MGGLCCSSRKTNYDFTFAPIPNPLSVYVPLASLTKPTVRSIILAVYDNSKPDWNNSRRTLLIFLLAINETLKTIKKNQDNDNKLDEHTVQHAKEVRQWLVKENKSGNNIQLDWNELQTQYQQMAGEKSDKTWKYPGISPNEPYFELTTNAPHPDIEQSRVYMNITRKDGFEPHELKVYWNAEQLEILCRDDGQKTEASSSSPPHDPSDDDVIKTLRQFPVAERKHAGKITYVNQGIQTAVFDIPKDAHIIVLNFANEQSPGGGYLRHAWAQEEIMLYNSDGYRSLLDLKYGRMGGGYAIPEFGLAYVRDICFFHPESKEQRRADMMVSACYCMRSPQLYDNPKNDIEWEENNLAKFRAFMAAAVANTTDDGSNTYLLLGPIGTGAFGNDVKAIGRVFRKALNLEMMGLSGPIRQAFGNIWFVSTDKWKNDEFEKILSDDKPSDDQ